jgi:hypothetical protein
LGFFLSAFRPKNVRGNSCAVNGCSNNRRKLNEWKQTFCELHQQKHEDCSCMIPYRLHTIDARVLSFTSVMADAARDLLMAAPMVLR